VDGNGQGGGGLRGKGGRNWDLEGASCAGGKHVLIEGFSVGLSACNERNAKEGDGDTKALANDLVVKSHGLTPWGNRWKEGVGVKRAKERAAWSTKGFINKLGFLVSRGAQRRGHRSEGMQEGAPIATK